VTLIAELQSLEATARERVSAVDDDLRMLRAEREQIIRIFQLDDMRKPRNGTRSKVIGPMRDMFEDGAPHKMRDVLSSICADDPTMEPQRIRQSVYAAAIRMCGQGEIKRVGRGLYQKVGT